MTTLANASGQPHTGEYRFQAYDAIRNGLGLLLLTAAGLKGYALATGPVAGDSLLTSRWFLIAVVEGELLLGLWLLSGLWSKAAWWGAVICFSAFASVALHQAVSGTESCGCFGKLEISPWYTFGADVVAIMALLAFPPNAYRARPIFASGRIAVVAVLMAAIGVPGGLAMALSQPPTLEGNGLLAEADGPVVLDLESWSDQLFPLRGYIDVGEQLMNGQWVVVLYRHTCPACRRALPRYEQKAQEWASQLEAPRLALIEVPPFASTGEDPVPSDTVALHGRLSAQYEWHVRVPASLDVQDGTVVGTPSVWLTGGIQMAN